MNTATIKDIKKGDEFTFNHQTYVVKRKWISDEKPLIAVNVNDGDEQRFHHEGLEIEKVTWFGKWNKVIKDHK